MFCVRAQQNHMATTFDLKISCEQSRIRHAESVLSEAQLLFARLEAELSEFRESSPVSFLNRAVPFQEVQVPLSVLELLEQAEALRVESQGAFDCLIKSGPIARKSEQAIQWDRKRQVAWRTAIDARLSFAAIGKGYALDQARTLLDREGFTDYVLNAGGSSIVLSGFAAPQEPWTWAWSWARNEEGQDMGIPFRHETGSVISLGVSGLHEKGKHLIDPATGSPAISCKSALVALPSASQADALSTALFVSLGSQGRFTFPSFNGGLFPFATASIDAAGIPRWNGWFQKLWGGLALASVSAFFLPFMMHAAHADDQAVDLGEMGANHFNPYLFERDPLLACLPALAIVLVLIHLIKYRPARRGGNPKKGTSS
jgi:FAD:protein FMN transferase